MYRTYIVSLGIDRYDTVTRGYIWQKSLTVYMVACVLFGKYTDSGAVTEIVTKIGNFLKPADDDGGVENAENLLSSDKSDSDTESITPIDRLFGETTKNVVDTLKSPLQNRKRVGPLRKNADRRVYDPVPESDEDGGANVWYTNNNKII